MGDYNKYIGELQKSRIAVDFDLMLSHIERQTAEQPRIRLAAISALVIVILSFMTFLSQMGLFNNREVLLSYVFTRGSLDGPVIDYVIDQGTI